MKPPGRSAAEAAVDELVAQGVQAVFGNPGTTELPLLAAMGRHSELTYYLALQEDVSTGMAAGYAAASGRVGVSMLHVAPGVAHGLSNYYNAWRNGLPVLLLSGQQDRRHQFLDPMLYADLEHLLLPFSKYSWEVRTAEEVPAVVARAVAEATTAPTGPTFVSLPLDLQLEVLGDDAGRSGPATPTRLGPAVAEDIVRAAQMMLGAENPAIIAGDIIGAGGCAEALSDFATLVGAAVYWEPLSTRANFSKRDPHFAGVLFPSGEDLRRVFDSHDVVLVCGMSLRAPTLFGGTRWATEPCKVIVLAPQAKGIDVGLDTHVHLVGDPALTVQALSGAVRDLGAGPDETAAISRRNSTLARDHEASRSRLRESAHRRAAQSPISPMALLVALLGNLPDQTTVVDEAVSSSGWVALAGDYKKPLDYLGPTKGGGIGYGLPAALGVQVADPSRNVLAILGDGAALYAIQGLWTAAHHNLPVVFCILNNASYRILKGGVMTLLGGDEAAANLVPGLDLDRPGPDFVQCARAFGIHAVRVDGIDDCVEAVRNAFATREPWLIDIAVERSARPTLK